MFHAGYSLLSFQFWGGSQLQIDASQEPRDWIYFPHIDVKTEVMGHHDGTAIRTTIRNSFSVDLGIDSYTLNISLSLFSLSLYNSHTHTHTHMYTYPHTYISYPSTYIPILISPYLYFLSINSKIAGHSAKYFMCTILFNFHKILLWRYHFIPYYKVSKMC